MSQDNIVKQFKHNCTLTLFDLIQHFILAQGSSTGLRLQLDAFTMWSNLHAFFFLA
jgi:hypothetical protein